MRLGNGLHPNQPFEQVVMFTSLGGVRENEGIRNKKASAMIEDSVYVLKLALRSVLLAARKAGLDVDEFSEAAIEAIPEDLSFDPAFGGKAALAIEVAVDALGLSGGSLSLLRHDRLGGVVNHVQALDQAS
jgi:hypothetical protein